MVNFVWIISLEQDGNLLPRELPQYDLFMAGGPWPSALLALILWVQRGTPKTRALRRKNLTKHVLKTWNILWMLWSDVMPYSKENPFLEGFIMYVGQNHLKLPWKSTCCPQGTDCCQCPGEFRCKSPRDNRIVSHRKFQVKFVWDWFLFGFSCICFACFHGCV